MFAPYACNPSFKMYRFPVASFLQNEGKLQTRYICLCCTILEPQLQWWQQVEVPRSCHHVAMVRRLFVRCSADGLQALQHLWSCLILGRSTRSNIYIYIYLEPEWPLFWTTNHPKYVCSYQNRGQLGSRYIYIYIYIQSHLATVLFWTVPVFRSVDVCVWHSPILEQLGPHQQLSGSHWCLT